jgi:predicted transposase/invertase (TIGR01784 family)
MSNVTIHHPHDGFFKHSLSNLTVARDLLQAHLSQAITQRIQWDSLRLSNKSYTDEKLAQLHSDLVYTCQIDNQEAYIYILIEQQTTPERLLPFRFLQYNVAMLAEHLTQNKKEKRRQRLPTILNLCLYTGKQTPYPYALDIYECFEDPMLARAEMFKPLSLVDLGQMEEDELASHGTADLLEMLLKQSQKRTYFNWIKEHPEEIKKLLDRFYGISGIIYILGVEKKHSAEELLQAIGNIVPQRKEDIMTAAQQLEQRGELRGIQQGMQQGIQQGMQQEKLHIAKNMLSKLHLDMQTVAKATGLSEEELMKLQQQEKG